MAKHQANSVTPIKTTSQDPLKSYLEYYKNLTEPGFAVLITGEWGSGKTYQIKNALNEAEYYYVSLFGLSKSADIHGAVLAKADPAAGNRKKLAKWLNDKTIGALGFELPAGSILSAVLEATVKDKIDIQKIIIFDDLERWAGDSYKSVLGALNYYVEHRGCRVVVLAHDIRAVTEFTETKEKVFGHTINIKPKSNEAFDVFAEQLLPRAKDIVVEHRPMFLELFRTSECNSLRILKHALAGIARLTELIEDSQIAKKRLLKEILSLYFAISVEVLRGNINREDLAKRSFLATFDLDSAFNGKKADEITKPTMLMIAYKKYEELVDLNSNLLSNQLLTSLIVDGHFEKEELQNYFAEIECFAKSEDLPAWRRFMEFDTRPDDEVTKAAAEMDEHFASNSIDEIGELMHIVMLRIMRAEHGMLNTTKEAVLNETKAYLDIMVKEGRFPLLVDQDLFEFHGAFGGVRFWGVDNNNEFMKKILIHLHACEVKNWKLLKPKFRNELLDVLKNDPSGLHRLLNYENGHAGKYKQVPVLEAILASEFVDSFLNLPENCWGAVQHALRKRFQRLPDDGPFEGEKNWFILFDKELMQRAAASEGTIRSLRILRHRISSS